MTIPFPEFLTKLLATLEREARQYVVYRDDSEEQRLVIRVDVPDGSGKLENELAAAGFVAVAGPRDDGVDFVLHETGTGTESPHFVQIKIGRINIGPGTGKSEIANLLWRAATEESAVAARASIRRDEDPS